MSSHLTGIAKLMLTSVGVVALTGLATTARGQDSVASTPGGNDALPVYDPTLQQRRYVVDLATVRSSWGRSLLVGPILKAPRDPNALFSTQTLGASAISGGFWRGAGGTGVVFPTTQTYAQWSAPGQGVNTPATGAQNNPPASSVNRTGYDVQFAAAIGALSQVGAGATASSPTNIIGARVGFDLNARKRLYVERTNALLSALTAGTGAGPDNTASLSLGAVDAFGYVSVRADEYGLGAFPTKIKGENIIRVDLSKRDVNPANIAAVNSPYNLLSPENQAWDAGSTTYLVNASTVTVNTPAGGLQTALPPAVPGGPPIPLPTPFAQTFTLDFAGGLRLNNGATTVSGHRASGVTGLRGNPSFSLATASGGSAGTLGFLGTTTTGAVNAVAASPARSINVAGVDFALNPLAPTITAGSARSATMPANISNGLSPGHPDVFTANAGGIGAEFRHWLSQVSFRGPSGQTGVGQTSGATPVLVAAATATDQGKGEFIAVVTNPGGSGEQWTVAAFTGTSANAIFPNGPRGQRVLSGPGGAMIGRLIAGNPPVTTPVAMSSPAVDLAGNVYFVSRWAPVSGADANTAQVGLFRATRAAAAPNNYEIELLLTTGQSIDGPNSGTTYKVAGLRLADADSIASGGFHQGQLIQENIPGRAASTPLSLFNFGGALVNATIVYQRGSPAGSVTEPYEAALFIGPGKTLAADINDDGVVNFLDLNIVLSEFGQTGTGLAGDVNGDGIVNFLDLNEVLSFFGQSAT